MYSDIDFGPNRCIPATVIYPLAVPMPVVIIILFPQEAIFFELESPTKTEPKYRFFSATTSTLSYT